MRIKFVLASGELIEAKQDCACRHTHPGPHWVYIDDLWRTKNKKLLPNNPRGFIHEELARLKEKQFVMERHGIVEVIREE